MSTAIVARAPAVSAHRGHAHRRHARAVPKDGPRWARREMTAADEVQARGWRGAGPARAGGCGRGGRAYLVARRGCSDQGGRRWASGAATASGFGSASSLAFDDFFTAGGDCGPLASDIANQVLGEFAKGFASPAGGKGGRGPAMFPVNVYQTDEKYVVKAELPGLSEENVTLQLERRTLTVSASRDRANKETKARVLRVERRPRKFERSFKLPRDVDRDNISAVMENGILTLALPRVAEGVERGRTIEVQKGSDASSDKEIGTEEVEGDREEAE